MRNSIKERAKKVPKRIKFKVAITVWWLKLRQYFVIKSVCDVCNGDGIDDSSFYNPPCGRCKGTGKQTVL